VPLCYQLIEREQLDHSQDREQRGEQNKIVGGVEIDGTGRRVAYWIYDAHPDDIFGGVVHGLTKSTRVPASRVIDLCLWHRPSANIGATWLDAIGQKDFDRDQFLDAEIRAAAKGALLALIHKTKNPYASGILGMLDGEDDSDTYGNEEVKLGLSPLAVQVGVDEDVAMVESNRPTAQAGPFFKLLDRDIASGVGLSYYSLTGDYESTSYSSVRAAKLDEDIHIGTLQQWFALHVAVPMRREFNQLAVASGMIESMQPREFNRYPQRYQRFDAIGAGRDLLDPLKETDAAMARLRGGLTTLKLECAKRGLHWIKVLMQQAVELRIAKMYGVPLDWSKGQGGNVAAGDDAGGDAGKEAEGEEAEETEEADA
jgi:lambda family phage portal protein